MTIRVHALEESGDYKPDGDCYAPQVVLTWGGGAWHDHTLNADMLPFDVEHFITVAEEFALSYRSPKSIPKLQRYLRIFWGVEMHHKQTHGYSQGDWGHSFVFATPEWLEMTGATGVGERDHNDFCAWLWGDVYEVFNDDPNDLNPMCPGSNAPVGENAVIGAVAEECPMIVYGMDEAMKYGDITFPTHRTITTYEYD